MDQILALAEAFSAAVVGKDIAALDGLYAKDAVVWHSYDSAEQTRRENLAWLSAFFGRAETIGYNEVKRQRTERGFVQQHILTVDMKDGAVLAPRPVCMVVEIAGGKIARIDEYVETGRVRPNGLGE